MKWLHAFCIENKISYYVLGGTLLGAVRHKGFIPWDDDIDVGMPREDYERFKACAGSIPKGSKYLLETPTENREFGVLFCKLYDTETTLIENTRFKARRGLYIDIFPIDGIGNTPEESRKNYKKIHRKKAFQYITVCRLKKKRSFFKNAAVLFSRMFTAGWKKRAIKIDRLCASRPYDECRFVGNLLGAWNEREIVERAWMGEPVLYPFEDMQVYGPCNADRYLTAVYGDYKKIPPEGQRGGSHDYLFLDLSTPYLAKETAAKQ